MKQFLYTLLATFLFINVQAQSIKGEIKAASGNVIEAATINILNTEKTTIADKQGNFSFTNITVGTYQLSISSIGYATQLKEVKIEANKTTDVTITLSEKNKQLDEVVVTADKIETNIQKNTNSHHGIKCKKD
jgi:iron complex outermembrane recepter protein